MLASWLKDRDQRCEIEAEARGREEGRKKQDQDWRAWYERYQAAQRESRGFSEPPPESPVPTNDS